MAEQGISYCITPSKLGRLLVATSDKGVCFLAFGDSDAPLLAELARDYPDVQPAEAGSFCFKLAARVNSYLEALPGQGDLSAANTEMLNIPLDVRGTSFQQQVWQELRRIPAGQAITYTQLAGKMGLSATSVRAAAHACATNPVSVLIPCHRVMRRDGGLGGYRWGLRRKQALLQAEGALSLLEL